MNFCEKYMEYTKDNPEGYWFKRKVYGWGWVPVTWQGWAVTLVVVMLIVANAIRLERYNVAESEFAIYLVAHTTILVVLLIAICYAKGEKPKWQWGFPKDKNKKIKFPK